MIIQLFNQILNCGIDYEKGLFDKRKVRFLNILYLISIISAETYSLIYLIIDASLLMPLIINANIFVLIYITGIYLNKINKARLSGHLLCSSFTAVTSISTFVQIGTVTDIHFYFLLFALAPLLVWSLKELAPILFYFLLNTVLFIYAHYALNPENIQIIFPSEARIFVSIFTIISVFISLLAALWINLSHIEENEKQLIVQSNDLNEMVEELNNQQVEIIYQKEVLNELNIELSAKNNALRESNATKDKFFTILAHDLKNPLGNFREVSRLLADSYHQLTDESKIVYLNLMKESSTNTFSLLENLLEWSLSQRGILTFAPEKLILKSIINDIIKLLSPQAEKKAIVVQNHIPENFMLTADSNMLHTIVRNLVSNAIKFSNTKGIISIESIHKDDFMIISIKDNGIGISDDLAGKLFKIGEFTTTKGTSGEKGTGLGLFLCKEFVEKHGGKIWLESEQGKGSTFSFSIPFKI